MMTHPKERDHKKADDVGDEVGDLLEQVGGQLGIGDAGDYRNLQVQHE
jgi:hypothetical protein